MDKCLIRNASLAGKNKEIKSLLISDQGLLVYKFVASKNEATARDVAEELGLSIQHASGVLAKLYRQQYLRRDSEPQESGGYEWVYFR